MIPTDIRQKFSRRSVAAASVALLLGGVLAGCVVEPRGRVVVRERGAVVVMRAPPAPRVEVIPAAPAERMVWNPGHWQWDGREYAWVPGHYVERPFREARWAPGHWIERDGGWVWEDGRWQ